MKVEQINEYVVPITVLVIGWTFAIYAGSAIGHGSFGLLGIIMFCIFALCAILGLRERIWICVPIAWQLSGKLGVLPLPFTVRELVVLLVFGSFLVLKALKMVRRKPIFGTVDLWLFLSAAYLVTVFARNPTGVDALGSDRVGGRPYWEVIVSLAAYWILSRSTATPRQAGILPVLALIGSSGDALLNWIAEHFPSTAMLLSGIYSNVTIGEEQLRTTDYVDPEAGTQREGFFGFFGESLLRVGSSYWRPLTMLNPLHFLRFVLLVLSFYCVLVSGFRSMAMSCAFTFLLSSYIRRGWVDVIRIGVFLIPALALLLSMQGLLFDLPRSMQRTLSFLPGHWDAVAVAEAQGSTQWRVDMWKQMLASDKYIFNRWLGDGFGFTKAQFAIIEANSNNPLVQGGGESQQENFMIMGEVHSGPISAIRYVGILGLLIHIGLMAAIAREAWRLIQRAKNSQYFVMSLFFGIPMLWEPINFLFIFGAYQNSVVNAFYHVGLLKLLTNSMQEPEASKLPMRFERHRGRPLPPAPAFVARRRPEHS